MIDPTVKPAEWPTELCEIMGRLGSDKGSATKAAQHNYTRYYSKLFAPIRDLVRDVLELGIFDGASLRGWREFFPRARIYGGDVDPRTIFQEDRIATSLVDSTDPSSVASFLRFMPQLDVIVDDGLHTLESNEAFLRAAFPMLRSGGVYVVEDLVAPERYIDLAEEFGGVVVGLHWPANDYDNNLLVIVKP